jgi:hypothetical protein
MAGHYTEYKISLANIHNNNIFTTFSAPCQQYSVAVNFLKSPKTCNNRSTESTEQEYKGCIGKQLQGNDN